MKIDCIAIDDEPLALDILRDYCSKVSFLNLLKTFDNAVDSVEFIRQEKVDLIFLDNPDGRTDRDTIIEFSAESSICHFYDSV